MAIRLRASFIAVVVLTFLTTGSALAAPPVIDPTPLPDGNVGAEYTAFISSSEGEGEGPHTFRLVDGKLPSGLKIERSFGVQSTVIHGIPTREGTSTFTVQVKDGAGNTATQEFTITVGAPLPLVVNNPSPQLRDGFVAEPYAANLFAVGGVQPYRWEIVDGALPDGLGIKGNVISGTPTTAGTFGFTARVTDKAGSTAEMAFTITVT